jgi:hypothetical protein
MNENNSDEYTRDFKGNLVKEKIDILMMILIIFIYL